MTTLQIRTPEDTRIAALSPTGTPPLVEPGTLATRPTDLDGRTVFLVNCRLRNSRSFAETLKTWFAEHHPEVHTEVVDWAGTYLDDPDLTARIVQEGDAAIFAIGTCSTCAPMVATHAMSLETAGIPTVAIHTEPFEKLVESFMRLNHLPESPRVYIPQPLLEALETDQILEFVSGLDPVREKPVMDLVLGALTAQDLVSGRMEKVDTPRIALEGSEEEIARYFLDQNWTDNLPIVVPTEERVAAMVAGTSHSADEVVGELARGPGHRPWSFTVEQVAVNAVMAGARPEYFPVILALAAGGVSARFSSTTGLSTMAFVNGPIRNEIAMNYGIGALGPYNHANATIGRAFGLLSQNLQGGSTPGVTYMASQGNANSLNSSFFAENEERSPWEPFHVQHGFDASESTVTVIVGGWYTFYGCDIREETWRENFQRVLRAMEPSAAPTLVLDPIAARDLVSRGGFTTKEALAEWLYEIATLPAELYWDTREVQCWYFPQAMQGTEPWASKMQAAPDELVPMFNTPSDISIVVAGGETMGTWRFLCGEYGDIGTTVRIDDWR